MRIPLAAVVLIGLLAALLGPRLLAREEEGSPAVEKKSFPASWEGRWRGPARSVGRDDRVLEFPMELVVRPLAGGTGHTWTIVYGEGEKRQVRPYELLPVDAEAGHWRIDEKNSILIDAWLVEDALHSRFEVIESSLDVRYALRDGGIDVTITTYGKVPVTESGGQGRIPTVASHALRAVQTARLLPVNDGD